MQAGRKEIRLAVEKKESERGAGAQEEERERVHSAVVAPALLQ